MLQTTLQILLFKLPFRRVLLELFDFIRRPRQHWIIREDFVRNRRAYQRIAQDIGSDHFPLRAFMAPGVWSVSGSKLLSVIMMTLRLGGYEGILVESLSRNSYWTRRFHQITGTAGHEDLYSYIARQRIPSASPEVRSFVNGPRTATDLMRVAYHDVPIGRTVLSDLIYRYRHQPLDLPRRSEEIVMRLRLAQRNVHAAESFLDRMKPDLLLAMEKGLPPSAELFGAAIARGIDFVQITGSQYLSDFILKRYNSQNAFDHPVSLDGTTWEAVKRMPWSDEAEQALLEEFFTAYQQGSWFKRKYFHNTKRIKPPEEVRSQLRLDPDKPNAVIFSHVLWDATVFYGEGLFEDYETWLMESVRAACENPRVNWIVKLHPDLIWKLRREGFTGELRDLIAIRSAVRKLPDHVQIVLPETDISTYSFFQITDYCLTVRGTVGIEMACHGVPVFTAGTGRYSHLGFTIDSKSKEEYLNRFAQMESQPSASPQQTQLARRFAHALFNLRPWPMRSFEYVHTHDQQLDHPLMPDLVARLDTAEAFRSADDMQRFLRWVQTRYIDYLHLNEPQETFMQRARDNSQA